MPEFRFHHLERRRMDQALPELLESALGEGLRAVVQARSPEEVEALNERLWTFADESFLPHGSASDGNSAGQPIYITDGDDNPNGARLRILLSGIDGASYAGGSYDRIVLLFHGGDETALMDARRQWTAIKATGAPVSYWKEGEDGGWVKAR